MLYGLLMQFLFVGLGLHYMLVADAPTRRRMVIGGILVVSALFPLRIPTFLLLSIQFLLSAYILIVYRIQDQSTY